MCMAPAISGVYALESSMIRLGETRAWIWGQTLSDRIARGINRLNLLAVALNPIHQALLPLF
jgi:hypothetical protein